MRGRTHLLIPVFMLLFGVLGSTLGIFEETYGLVSVFVGMGLALGYDPLVGGAVVYVGVATGFAAATTNPFSVGIAQSIAEVPHQLRCPLPPGGLSGVPGDRDLVCDALCQKGQGPPEQSVMYGVPMEFTPPDVSESDGAFTLRQKLCLLLVPGHRSGCCCLAPFSLGGISMRSRLCS